MKLSKYCEKHLSLTYKEGSGLSVKLLKKGSTKSIGDSTGVRHGKYWRVDIQGRKYSCHHIVYAMSTGDWKGIKKCKGMELNVCHLDDNADNNTPDNLLLLPASWNQQMRKPSKGYKGVSKGYKGKWVARIMIGGVTQHLGVFKSELRAAKEYDKYAKKFLCPYAYLNLRRS